MIRRFSFVVVIGLSATGCSLGSNSTPSPEGRDALGKQVYSLGGDRLAVLEATANSNCPGVTRPYFRSVTGWGDHTNVTYTCE
ncbi:MAG: hypothetical protein JWO51_3588 [Rhodospirillales bacterium]|nr:hypothetical protein [Rhodospirillales bacterium]